MTGKLTTLSNGVICEDGRAVSFRRAKEILERDTVRNMVQQSESVIVGNSVYADDRSTIRVHLTADWQHTLCGIELDNISEHTVCAVSCRRCTESFRRYSA